MTTPVKNNQTPPPANEPYSKNYGNDPYGGEYGGYDPGTGGGAPPSGDVSTSNYENGDYGDYGDFSDMGMGEDGLEVEGGEEGAEGAEGPSSPQGGYTTQSVGQMLRDLQGTLSESDYKAFQGRINATTGMSPDRAATELAKIADELYMISNPEESVDEMTGEDGEPVANTEEQAKLVDDFKDELEDYKDDIEGMENLSEDEKAEHMAAVDTMIKEIELAEKDPERLAEIDVESMTEGLKEIKEAVDGANQYSQGAKSLAELAGMEPAQLQAKADAAGIDLSNLSLPPPMELFDFLKEISPELKTKLEAVETAMNEQAKFYETNKTDAENRNKSNTNSTSDTDNVDTTAWQNLYNLKFHQDDKSKAVMEAMKAVTDTLKPLLEALYPGQEVKPVETSGLSGWEKTHADYAVADQISIGGTVIDLFNDTDGKVQSSTTLTENGIAIEIPTIKADREGDGEWTPTVNGYSDTVSVSSYDEGA